MSELDKDERPYNRCQFHEYKDHQPVADPGGGRTWWARGQNYIVAYSQAKPGTRFQRKDHPDEYMVYLPDAAGAAITVNGQRAQLPANSLSIVPPGASDIEMQGEGQAIVVYSSQSADLTDKCFNAAAYATPHARVAPLKPWPAPKGGYKLRIYPLDQYPPTGYPSNTPWKEGSGDPRFGRYFRSTNLLVHLQERRAARDQGKTFPHASPDYEQCAVCLTGERIHHVRTPWGPDMSKWVDDEHIRLGSPSILVFTPGLIHTTTTVSGASKWMDVFSPPRLDISQKPGWVRNHDEYPLP
jgi:hypothetical protein